MESSSHSILSPQQISTLARSYDTLAYLPALSSLLSKFSEGVDFSAYPKRKLHECINNILIEQHQGEMAFKYQLFRRASRQNLVAAFEIRVHHSRMDFLTVNGVSHGYEIKSGLDNLAKLSRQAKDYASSFDFNTVVVDTKHKDNALKILPASFGVMCIDAKHRRRIYRMAARNATIDPRMQLSLLTQIEKKKHFAGTVAADRILTIYNDRQVNRIFKQALKERYRSRWEFVVKHSAYILPIDLQFFFNRNIEPDIIYQLG
jgi:hypothetical protein